MILEKWISKAEKLGLWLANKLKKFLINIIFFSLAIKYFNLEFSIGPFLRPKSMVFFLFVGIIILFCFVSEQIALGVLLEEWLVLWR